MNLVKLNLALKEKLQLLLFKWDFFIDTEAGGANTGSSIGRSHKCKLTVDYFVVVI